MCFTHDDCDWTASICEIKDVTAEKACTCFECGSAIAVGEAIQSVWMQENECETCMDHAGDPDLGPVPEGHECGFGETFSCVLCAGCVKLRAAIKDRELKEGCPEWSSVPSFGDLSMEMHEHGDRVEYANHAVAMFPELTSHPLIAMVFED